MSVHTSVTRCLRTSSTLGHPTPSSFRGRQLFQFYQTSRYATNDSPNEKQTAKPDGSAAQSTSSKTSPAEGTTGPARPSPPSSAATNSTEASATGAAGTTNNDNTTGSPNLMESLATLRENVRYATQPIDLVRATRKFQRGGGVATRAHQTAQEQLDRLLGRKPTGSSGQQQQQQRQPAAAQPGTASEGSSFVPSSSSSSVLDQNDSLKPPPKVRGVPIKLGTKLGRQVLVSHERGVDLAGAIRMVQINCAVNGVRRQSNQQKFHVRRGQRRKDLKSQRWRKLFKFSFDATVKKIQRMRNQGW